MTLTWIRMRRRRANSYMIWNGGSRALRVMRALQNGEGQAHDILDVPAVGDRPDFSPLSAPAGPPVPRLRA